MSDLPSWAVPGQEVVCIVFFAAQRGLEPIAKNRKLTIRDVSTGSYQNGGIRFGLRFVEIVNPTTKTRDGVTERLYTVEAFRPLIKKTIEQDMEIFAPLLQTKREEELV